MSVDSTKSEKEHSDKAVIIICAGQRDLIVHTTRGRCRKVPRINKSTADNLCSSMVKSGFRFELAMMKELLGSE